jgi:hypothetical protein
MSERTRCLVNLVVELWSYRWSSYWEDALGEADPLLAPNLRSEGLAPEAE